MSRALHLAISTCPNDTFAFHGLMTGKVDLRGLEFQITLHDVQELNEGLMRGEFDIAKASFHAALLLAEKIKVFASGAALGFGVGPLLLARDAEVASNVSRIAEGSHEMCRDLRLLCPGNLTTATLLCKLFYPKLTNMRQRVFSEIMPSLVNGTADLGVCIHEGRFTWRESGLALVSDLGELWESRTKCPLPLGGIVGRRSLGDETLSRIQEVLRESVEYGLAHREETLPTMRQFAQEFDDAILMSHVDLYVNRWTIDMADEGRSALAELDRLAAEIGLKNDTSTPVEIAG